MTVADDTTNQGGIRYLASGHRTVDRPTAEADLAAIVEVTLQRLDEAGVRDSILAKEWAETRALGPEEAAYADAVARLGIDPFDAPSEIGDAVVAASETPHTAAAARSPRCGRTGGRSGGSRVDGRRRQGRRRHTG